MQRIRLVRSIFDIIKSLGVLRIIPDKWMINHKDLSSESIHCRMILDKSCLLIELHATELW